MANLKVKNNLDIRLTLNSDSPANAVYDINALYRPGDIIIYMSGSIPSGWLLCDGSLYSETDYVDLSNAIGKYYGGGTEARLPKLYDSTNPSYPLYPASTIGTPTSMTLGSYTTHNHTFSTSNATTDTFTTAAHSHSGSATSTTVTTVHSHANLIVQGATTGGAWGVGNAIANYTSAGSSGSHSYINHTHNHTSSNAAAGNATVNHSHTATLSTDTTKTSGHSHTSSYTLTTDPGNILPSTKTVRFIIKY